MVSILPSSSWLEQTGSLVGLSYYCTDHNSRGHTSIHEIFDFSFDTIDKLQQIFPEFFSDCSYTMHRNKARSFSCISHASSLSLHSPRMSEGTVYPAIVFQLFLGVDIASNVLH